MKTTETNKNKTSLPVRLVILFIFITIAFLLFFLYQNQQKSKGQITPTPVILPTPVVLKAGYLSFKSIPGGESVSPNNTLNLDIVAGSDQNAIVSYDVILKFKEDEFDIVSATSLLPDFAIFPTKGSDNYIITAAKILESQLPSVFSDTPILRLTVMAKKSGSLTLNIVNNLGAKKSQQVDDKTRILIPEVDELTLVVK